MNSYVAPIGQAVVGADGLARQSRCPLKRLCAIAVLRGVCSLEQAGLADFQASRRGYCSARSCGIPIAVCTPKISEGVRSCLGRDTWCASDSLIPVPIDRAVELMGVAVACGSKTVKCCFSGGNL